MSTSPLTWMEIDKGAFCHNVAQFKRIIGAGNLAAVIKSNAYGHDLHLIAQLCEKNPQVDWLCVASLSEALTLRAHSIKKPILVLSYIDADLQLAAAHDIDIICYEKELLDHAHQIGAALNKKINIHVKIDTGLARFGLAPRDALTFIRYATKLPYVHVNGIFTHFAQSQDEDQSFTDTQDQLFQNLIVQLAHEGINFPLRHCANSAAALLRSPGQCNFFRVGAGLYGLWPSEFTRTTTQEKYPDFELKTILTWKTTITSLHHLEAGCTVGYDRTFITNRPTTIALLPVGYYEGFDRRLSNAGMIRVHDVLVPIVGRVCMNVIMADVTDIKQVKKGDIAQLIGDHEGIRPTDIAAQSKSFNAREIVSRLNAQIPRIVTGKENVLRFSAVNFQGLELPDQQKL